MSAQKTGVRISSAPPYLGVAHLAERSLWKREAEGAAPSAQTISLSSTIGRCNCFKRSELTVRIRLQGPSETRHAINETNNQRSMGEQQIHLPVKQPPHGFPGASPGAPNSSSIKFAGLANIPQIKIGIIPSDEFARPLLSHHCGITTVALVLWSKPTIRLSAFLRQ